MGKIEREPGKGILAALADASPEQLRIFIGRLKEGEVPNGLVVLEELGGKDGFAVLPLNREEKEEFLRRKRAGEDYASGKK